MRIKIFTFLIFLLVLLSISTVAAGDNTTDDTYIPKTTALDGQVVEATESGNFNITFSNNYNGYCLEYGEHDAMAGDKFIVANSTDYEINKSVSNCLKTFFVDFYDEAMKNKIVTQHTIWHFTDGFDGWRLNYTMIQQIKDIAAVKNVPDTGKVKYNATHDMHYSFLTLVSPYEHHQNFFAYKIWFKEIDDCCCINNTTNNYFYNITNVTNIIHNITNIYYNYTTIINNITNNNYTTIANNITNNTIISNNYTTIVNNITNNTIINNNYTTINNNYTTIINNITNNNHTIIIDNSTSIIQHNNYTNITYVNFTKTENNITVIYNCAIINIGCGNTTNIMNDVINYSSTYLSKSLNNQLQNQLNDYIMMKLAGNKKAKILLVIVLVIMMLCIGGYGYRRKI